MNDSKCHGCGMPTDHPAEYHPFTACVLFKATHNSNTVRSNLKAVIEYGMRANKAGVSLDAAMANLTNVLKH